MTIYVPSFIGLAAVLVAAGYCVLVHGANKRKAAQAPAPAKVRQPRGELRDGFCPWCSRPGTYLTRKGLPNLRYHNCHEGHAGTVVNSATWPPAPPTEAA